MNKLFQIGLLITVFFYKTLAVFFSSSKSTKKKGVLYLAAFYPGNSGYHWRAFKWVEELKKSGRNDVHISYTLEEDEFRDYANNQALFLTRFIHRRFWQIVKARNYKTVIVRREIVLFNSYGNLFLEKMLRRLCDNIILDIDDDLAASKKQPYTVSSLYGKLLQENGNSFRASFQYYDKFIVASTYLKEYVLKHREIPADNICIIPTCVDYDKYPPKIYDNNKETISLGWIGGDHNYPLLQSIIPLLNELSTNYKFNLIVIGGKPFQAATNFELIPKKWSLETEVEDLLTIDVGLMPLDNSESSKGKGGFKFIQYMGLGVVGVAQNITVNAEICDNGRDSFLYSTNKDLKEVLINILEKQINLSEIGAKARQKVTKYFTFTGNKEKYINFIEN